MRGMQPRRFQYLFFFLMQKNLEFRGRRLVRRFEASCKARWPARHRFSRKNDFNYNMFSGKIPQQTSGLLWSETPGMRLLLFGRGERSCFQKIYISLVLFRDEYI